MGMGMGASVCHGFCDPFAIGLPWLLPLGSSSRLPLAELMAVPSFCHRFAAPFAPASALASLIALALLSSRESRFCLRSSPSMTKKSMITGFIARHFDSDKRVIDASCTS